MRVSKGLFAVAKPAMKPFDLRPLPPAEAEQVSFVGLQFELLPPLEDAPGTRLRRVFEEQAPDEEIIVADAADRAKRDLRRKAFHASLARNEDTVKFEELVDSITKVGHLLLQHGVIYEAAASSTVMLLQ